jgi:signal peptidase I
MIQAGLAAAATLAGTAALIAWLRRSYVVIDVEGPSMQPTLSSGDRVLVRRRLWRHMRAGDIVVAENRHHLTNPVTTADARRRFRNLSGHTWIIKRAVAMPGDPVPAAVAATVSASANTLVPNRCMVVLGDNPALSTDSRHYGYLTGDRVLGVVVRRLPPSDKKTSDRQQTNA